MRFRRKESVRISGVSNPIYSVPTGWFRYNYDRNCLEFLNYDTRLVVQTWGIPVDQWETLPSKQEYCKNLIDEANQKAQNLNANKKIIKFIFILSAGLSIALWYLSITKVIKWYDHFATAIQFASTGVAAITLGMLVNAKNDNK